MTNSLPLFHDWDDAGPPPSSTLSHLGRISFLKACVSPSCLGVFLRCFGFVFGWVFWFVCDWKTPSFLLSPTIRTMTATIVMMSAAFDQKNRQIFRSPDCHVCGFDWACRTKFWSPSLKGLWWLLGLAGPATREILEMHWPRMKV